MSAGTRLLRNYAAPQYDSTYRGRIYWRRAAAFMPIILSFTYNKLSVTIVSMSFLFHEKTKKAIKWIWGGFALLIILSMIFAYSGGAAIFGQ